MTALFELESIGGPWGRRLEHRRAAFAGMPWHEGIDGSKEALDAARWVWTQSAFSEYASAAAFADIAGALLAARAPLELIAAAGEFIVDEMLHAELSARVAMALGGAVPLRVDFTRLSRPPSGEAPLRRAAELVVRTSCVGEALTLPVLKTTAAVAVSPLIRTVVTTIATDESAHAELGAWFLDWADGELTDADRAHLGEVASEAVASFAPLFGGGCDPHASAGLGVVGCDAYDVAFAKALESRVVAPLGLRGIHCEVPKLAFSAC